MERQHGHTVHPYACVMYIASYMLKSEKGMSELLRQVSREYRGEDIKVQLKKLKAAFLNHREVGAQEAVYRILSLPLLSRKFIFINSSPKQERVTMLKPTTCQLEKIDKDADDIYMTSLIDRYSARPDSCAWQSLLPITPRSGNNLEDGETNDTLPPSEDQQTSLLRVQLKNNMGSMYKRSREAIIRFHRFNHEKEADKLYRSKLMLYLPWKDEDIDLLGEYPDFREDVDLLGEYPDFRSHYEDKHDVILANERKYSQNSTLISEAMDDLTEHGPP